MGFSSISIVLVLFILKSSTMNDIEKTSQMEIKDILLEYHNKYRMAHCAPPLIWEERMSTRAKEFAEKLVSSNNVRYNQRFGFGENIFLRYEANPTAFSTKLNFTNVTAQWYREIENYDFDTGQNVAGKEDSAFGHLTAILWYSTQRIGCGVAVSKWEDENYFKAISSLVCNYWPSGNIEGAYLKNVFKNRNLFKGSKCPSVTMVNPFRDYSNFEDNLSYVSELNYTHPTFWTKRFEKRGKKPEKTVNSFLSSTEQSGRANVSDEYEFDENGGNCYSYDLFVLVILIIFLNCLY